jgi:hypothetical protein
VIEDEAYSWRQETRKLLGPPGQGKKIRNPPGNHPVLAEMWVLLDLWCSGEAKEKKKKKKKILSCFFFLKSQFKISFSV